MSAVAVNSFETDAIKKGVVASTAVPSSRLASP